MLNLYEVTTHINVFYVLTNSKEEAIELIKPKIFPGFQIFCRKLQDENIKIIRPSSLLSNNLKDYIETYRQQGKTDPFILASNCIRLHEDFKKYF